MPNKSLPRTFDPPPSFSAAKAGVASNAAEPNVRLNVAAIPTSTLMKKHLRFFYLTAQLLTLIVVGCAGGLQNELPLEYNMGSDSRLGVVIGSVGAKPAPGNPPWYEWSRYDFHSLTDPDTEGHITSAFKWNPFYMWGSMPLCADDGLESECGYLFAMLLPAGDYEIHQVTPAMMSRSVDNSFTQRGWTLPLKDYNFVVYPGQAVYIGNLLSRICVGRIKRGNHVLSAIGVVKDMSERDMPLLVAKYPQLEGVKILHQPVSGTPWLWRYKKNEGFVPPYGWPKDCSLEFEQIEDYLNADGK